ncbi:MAG TPA: amidohydrolase family protein [Bryobacteraceae bacterium]|nr:amidohydrolase family protein [Bryobacteraceae bacterium]
MTGWLPDYLWRQGEFQSGVAVFVNSSGQITGLSSDAADLARAERLAGRAMLPGLVNTHSHAFQRAIRGRTERRGGNGYDTFWTWREAMYQVANKLSPEALYHVARMAFLEMLFGGITSVGEFYYLHRDPGGDGYPDRNALAMQTIRAAEDTGLRIALLRAAYTRAGWNQPADPAQARFITARAEHFMTETEALARQCSGGGSWVGVATA